MNFATNMLRVVGAAALTVMLMASMPSAQAATQTWSFSGTYESNSFSGNFSFDDALLSVQDSFDPNTFYAPVSSFSMNYLGTSYSLADVLDSYAEVSYYGNSFLGLSTSVSDFTFVAGAYDLSDAYITTDFGSADVIYAPIPEPQSYAMLLAGLGLLGFASRRWVK